MHPFSISRLYVRRFFVSSFAWKFLLISYPLDNICLCSCFNLDESLRKIFNESSLAKRLLVLSLGVQFSFRICLIFTWTLFSVKISSLDKSFVFDTFNRTLDLHFKLFYLLEKKLLRGFLINLLSSVLNASNFRLSQKLKLSRFHKISLFSWIRNTNRCCV